MIGSVALTGLSIDFFLTLRVLLGRNPIEAVQDKAGWNRHMRYSRAESPNPCNQRILNPRKWATSGKKLSGYFQGVAHHRPYAVDEEQFVDKVSELTEFLRVLVIHIPFEAEQELDALIAEVEGHD